jgi:hypothetical protein
MFCRWQQLFVQCLCQRAMMKAGKIEKRQITQAKSYLEFMSGPERGEFLDRDKPGGVCLQYGLVSFESLACVLKAYKVGQTFLSVCERVSANTLARTSQETILAC